jgi:hypothetical protein
MGARIRSNGTVICAAMHPSEAGDIYLTDQQLYDAVEAGELRASPTHLHREDCSGENCDGTLTGGSGARLCGDGLWLRREFE